MRPLLNGSGRDRLACNSRNLAQGGHSQIQQQQQHTKQMQCNSQITTNESILEEKKQFHSISAKV